MIVKARRKTATAEDLLFAGASDGSHLAAAAVSPVVSARAAVIVDSTLNPALIPSRAEPGGSPPERDYSLVPPSKPASSRVNRSMSFLCSKFLSVVCNTLMQYCCPVIAEFTFK